MDEDPAGTWNVDWPRPRRSAWRHGSTIREAAEQLLEEMPEGSGRLIIDLTHTREVDSAGLGALMLIQRLAAERRQPVVLRNPSEEIRFLLTITKLYDLFTVESSYD